ncbi:MAG: DUF378 domain-containing protein [Symbiobacterium sp.]|uniref:DUF378 domain-containing protein n=1 Tax=Symbiobacterium sp. TaxID=1971213 RepID=UPI003464400C
MCEQRSGGDVFIARLLVIIGALNWGLIGLFGFDLVAFLFGGQMSVVSRIVYTAVGIAGAVLIGDLVATRQRT